MCTSSAKIAVLRPICLELNQLASVVNLQGPALRSFKATQSNVESLTLLGAEAESVVFLIN